MIFMFPQLVLLSMLFLVPTQIPFEEYIAPHETGWELSTGDHDWFIEWVDYKRELFVNQSSEIMVYINLNGTDPFPANESGWISFSEENYAFKATIHLTSRPSVVWFDIGLIPWGHDMQPRLWDCDSPRSLDLDCFSYLYNWSYPSGDYLYEVYDEWGRYHWVGDMSFFVNVSLGDSWETFGWYRYPSLTLVKYTVEEWEITKPPPGWDDPPICGGVYYEPNPFDKYITERNFLLIFMVAIGLWYSGDIYRIIKPKDVSKDGEDKIQRTSEEPASENNPKTKTS